MAFFSNTAVDDAAHQRFEQLAALVQAGLDNFRKIGRALSEIRDKELYKCEFTSFAACCDAKWKITRAHADRLIAAATLADLLAPTGVVISSERQIRPLTQLPAEQQVAAFIEAQEEGGTSKAIERAVRKRRPRKTKKLRPIRLRSAGGWVTIEPNKKFVSVELTLSELLKAQREHNREAA